MTPEAIYAFSGALELDHSGYAIGVGNFGGGQFDMACTYPTEFQRAYMAGGWVARDPVVLTCARQEADFTWGVDQVPQCRVMTRAADFGLTHGASTSSLIAGSSCIISLADHRPLNDTARASLRQRIKHMHFGYLKLRARNLTVCQRDTMTLFALGLKGKQVAHEFSVSEEAIKLRKQRILKQIGITSFYTAIHICAVAGVTVH